MRIRVLTGVCLGLGAAMALGSVDRLLAGIRRSPRRAGPDTRAARHLHRNDRADPVRQLRDLSSSGRSRAVLADLLRGRGQARRR